MLSQGPTKVNPHVRINSSNYVSRLSNCKLVNKQLNDKERVAAALENNALLGVVEQCLTPLSQK